MSRPSRQDKQDRKQRVILGSPRKKLEQVEKADGYHYRYFNDDGNRINDALASGYQFVNKTEIPENSEAQLEKVDGIDSRESKQVGKNSLGEPMQAYLMRKPIDMHIEDQQIKQAEIDKNEQAIYRDKMPAGSNLTPANSYGHITMKNQRG